MAMTGTARHVGDLLRPVTAERAPPGATVCVLPVHNEVNLLPALLGHYRDLGPIAFVAVDDRSDDGSREFLAAQPDVTLYEPAPESRYAAHKRDWRRALLDAWADGAWCLVPDADELLIWPGMATRGGGLADLIAALEAEGAEALLAAMIDMYADAPLGDHRFDGGDAASLMAAFPLFDGPAPPPLGYRLLPPPTGFRRRFATPRMMVWGGMRERLFFGGATRANAVQRRMLTAWAHMGRPLNPGPVERLQNEATRVTVRRLFRSNRSRHPFAVTKLPLLRWRRGLRFSGGPHAVGGAALQLSERIAGLLHYKFTRGAAGIAYTARRGQHIGGAGFYRDMLAAGDGLSASPVFAATRAYDGPDSMAGILR